MTMSYAQPMPRRYTRARLAVPALWRQVVRAEETSAEGDEGTVREPDRSAYTQLEIYDGFLAAFDRRTEVAEVLRTSADRTIAVRRLRAVRGRKIQGRRFSRDENAAIEIDRDAQRGVSQAAAQIR